MNRQDWQNVLGNNYESGIDPPKIVAESIENNRENIWFSRYFFVPS